MPRRLLDDLKQTRPFDTPEEEAFVSIARTAAVLDHALGEVFKPFGVTATQYNVLRILRGAGREGLCRNDVRDRLVAQVPDVTRLLDRMDAAGLISRERSTTDRRVVTTRITSEGQRLLERLRGPVERLQQRCLGHMSHAQLERLGELLERARSGVAPPSSDPDSSS